MTDTTSTTLIEGDVLEFQGKRFRLADKMGLMPLLRFAHFAKAGVDTDDMESLVVIHDVLEQVIAPEDWDAFVAHAAAVRADTEDLMAFMTDGIQVMGARPTVRPSDSSDGPPTTAPSSSGDSSPAELSPRQEQARHHLTLMSPVGEIISGAA